MRVATIGGRIAAAIALATWCAVASGLSLSLLPSGGTFAEGTPFSLALRAQGLPVGEHISAYDVGLSVPVGITYTGATSGNALGSSDFEVCTSVGPGCAMVDVFESSFELDPTFFDSQPDPVTLAHLTFVGTALGSFEIGLVNPIIANVLGFGLDVSIPQPFSVSIVAAAAAPEPATPLLVALASLALAFAFRRQRR